MLHLIEDRSQIDLANRRMTLVIESDLQPFPAAIDELQSPACRDFAAEQAIQLGLPSPQLEGVGSSGYYAINDAGIPLHEIKDEKGKSLPLTDPQMQVAGYRIDIALRGNAF